MYYYIRVQYKVDFGYKALLERSASRPAIALSNVLEIQNAGSALPVPIDMGTTMLVAIEYITLTGSRVATSRCRCLSDVLIRITNEWYSVSICSPTFGRVRDPQKLRMIISDSYGTTQWFPATMSDSYEVTDVMP
jgi:hypothetical protein